MKLEINRKEFYDDRTIGGLYIDGHWGYHCLEDKDRKLESGGIKVYGETAIPRGKYKVELDWSSKRKALVPYLRAVPQFSDIQIHIANEPIELLGCIGIGNGYDVKTHNILDSTKACKDFYIKLLNGLIDTKNDVWITVT